MTTTAIPNSMPNEQVVGLQGPESNKCSPSESDTAACGSRDVVPPEETVPCTDKEDAEPNAKELGQPKMRQQNTDTGSVLVSSGVEGGEETQDILRHLLQRVQQQDASIQNLQKTVESQNATLQALMTTMQAGFAAVLEKEQKAAEPQLKRLISPERDHPTLLPTNEGTPESFKDCLKGETEEEIDPARAKDLQYCDDNSITIQQLQQPPRPKKATTTERPALRVPHRAKMMNQSDVSSLGMSHHNETQSIPMNANSKPTQPAPKAVATPAFGKKSSSMLLDEDDDNSTITSHDHNMDLSRSQDNHTTSDESHVHSPIGCNSCRGRLAKPSSRFTTYNDKVPSPPIYFPSPLNHTSANRMPTRLSRATSAPLSSYAKRRGTELPRLPSRLPTREDSVSEGLADDSSKGAAGNATANFFAARAMPAIERSKSALSPRLPSRRDTTLTPEVLDLTTMERNITSSTTSTATTMPRLPTRYCSVSEGLDASRMLGGNSTATSVEEDILDTSTEEQPTETDTRSQGVPSNFIALDNHDSSASTLAGTTITSASASLQQTPARQQSNSSLSWAKFKQLSATSSQQISAASMASHSGDHAVIAGKHAPRRSLSRSSLRGSRRDIFAKQGLAHLHVSCVTLDSALVDETHEWSSYDGDESKHSSYIGDESSMDQTKGTAKSSQSEGVPHQVVVDTKKMADGRGDKGLYTGTVTATDNLPSGDGVMHYDNGKYYKGEWSGGHWHGSGLLLSANGDSYRGDFIHSIRHGHGVYEYDNGDKYDGAFQNDKPHGMGVFKFSDHSVYQGGFVFGSFEGKGWYEFDQGRYDGDWKAGCYDGFGTLRFADGACYTGLFESGKAHGKGEEVTAAGVSRKGLWRHGDFVKEQEL